jgi:hypothetical protein
VPSTCFFRPKLWEPRRVPPISRPRHSLRREQSKGEYSPNSIRCPLGQVQSISRKQKRLESPEFLDYLRRCKLTKKPDFLRERFGTLHHSAAQNFRLSRSHAQINSIKAHAKTAQKHHWSQISRHERIQMQRQSQPAIAAKKIINHGAQQHVHQPAADFSPAILTGAPR